MPSGLPPEAVVNFIDRFIAFYRSVLDNLPRDSTRVLGHQHFTLVRNVPQFTAELAVYTRVLSLKEALDFDSDEILERGFDEFPPEVDSDLCEAFRFTRELIRDRWQWDLEVADLNGLRIEMRRRSERLRAAKANHELEIVDRLEEASLIDPGRSRYFRVGIKDSELTQLRTIAENLRRHRPLIGGVVPEESNDKSIVETDPRTSPR
jgi:hypothetical protein